MSKTTTIQLEYILNITPKLLFNYIGTADGLQRWFADKVEKKDKTFNFIWDGSAQQATQVVFAKNELVRYEWDETGDFFEFEIKKDDLANGVALIITDQVDESEAESSTNLWNNLIDDLRRILGC